MAVDESKLNVLMQGFAPENPLTEELTPGTGRQPLRATETSFNLIFEARP